MESHLDVGMVGPQLLDWDGKPGRSSMRFQTLWSLFCRAVALDRVFSKSRALGGFLMSDFYPEKPVDVDILNGWFWMVRREALFEVGALDRRFFMYGEDMDWSRRFHQAGWRVVLCPDAKARHYGGGCSEIAVDRFLIEREKANLQCWRKVHGGLSTLVYRAICCMNLFLRVLGFTLLVWFSPQKRPGAIVKQRKSAACLRWFVTLKSWNLTVQDEQSD
jgi:GT2 family glycosyltransferase